MDFASATRDGAQVRLSLSYCQKKRKIYNSRLFCKQNEINEVSNV